MDLILKIILIIAVVFAAAGVISTFDRRLRVREYTVKTGKAGGVRIVLISDTHMRAPKDLIPAVRQAKPDIIALCGDILDERRQKDGDYVKLIGCLRELCGIAEVYSVSGNHDVSYDGYGRYLRDTAALGIVHLENKEAYFNKNGVHILLRGITDFNTKSNDKTFKLPDSAMYERSDDFTVTLFHRATFAEEVVSATKCDLALLGHVHGGQWRIPFGRGVFSPERTFFPKYDGGIYDIGGKAAVVCRGSGISPLIPRIFNPPEICLIKLGF